MALGVCVERLLVENRAVRDVYQDGVGLHPGQLILPDEPPRGLRQGQRDHHVALPQYVLEIVRRTEEVRRLGADATRVDRVDPHAERSHEACGGAPDPAKAPNAAPYAGKASIVRGIAEIT